jgi:hypothetical protein
MILGLLLASILVSEDATRTLCDNTTASFSMLSVETRDATEVRGSKARSLQRLSKHSRARFLEFAVAVVRSMFALESQNRGHQLRSPGHRQHELSYKKQNDM